MMLAFLLALASITLPPVVIPPGQDAAPVAWSVRGAPAWATTAHVSLVLTVDCETAFENMNAHVGTFYDIRSAPWTITREGKFVAGGLIHPPPLAESVFPFDGVIDFAGPSGVDIQFGGIPVTIEFDTSASTFTARPGTNNCVPFVMQTLDTTQFVTNCDSWTMILQQHWQATITVTYQ